MPGNASPTGGKNIQIITNIYVYYSFKDVSYLFLERGEGREKERERNIHGREKYRLVSFRLHAD